MRGFGFAALIAISMLFFAVAERSDLWSQETIVATSAELLCGDYSEQIGQCLTVDGRRIEDLDRGISLLSLRDEIRTERLEDRQEVTSTTVPSVVHLTWRSRLVRVDRAAESFLDGADRKNVGHVNPQGDTRTTTATTLERDTTFSIDETGAPG
jgi:hypothetical protein